jgi:hypothetical protein
MGGKRRRLITKVNKLFPPVENRTMLYAAGKFIKIVSRLAPMATIALFRKKLGKL